jgi:hypothetical protein
MEEKKDSLDLDVTSMLQENYIPSESERKKVVLYYFLVGIIIALTKKNITKYEFFHLRQAMWWWAVFFLVFITSMIFIFIPFIRLFPILFFIFAFAIWIIFVKQAWEWKYVVDINWDEKILFPFFVGIWGWMLDVFDIKFEFDDIEKKDV